MAETDISSALGSDEADDRLEEWRELVGEHVHSVRRISPTVVDLVLDDSPDVIMAAVELGRREHGCCDFLDVSLSLRSNEVLLRLSAPEEAEVVLDALVGEPTA